MEKDKNEKSTNDSRDYFKDHEYKSEHDDIIINNGEVEFILDNPVEDYDDDDECFPNQINDRIYSPSLTGIVIEEFPDMDMEKLKHKLMLAPITTVKEIRDIPYEKLLDFYNKNKSYIWIYLYRARKMYGGIMDFLNDLGISKGIVNEKSFITVVTKIAIAHGIIMSDDQMNLISNNIGDDNCI